MHLDEARAVLREGDAASALDLALAVLAERPADADAHIVAGLALYRLRRLPEALRHFDLALSLGDADATLVFNRASCLYSLGRFSAAQAAFAKAAVLAQADPAQSQLRGLSLLNAGYAAADGGRWADAQRYHDRARSAGLCARLEGSCEDLQGELDRAFAESQADARARIDMGQYEAARSTLQGALAARPHDAELNYHAGVAAFAQGDDEAAYRYLARAQRYRLGGQTAEVATAYLDRLAGGVRLLGRGFSLLASAFVAYDENVTYSAASEAVEELLGAEASPALGLLVDLSYGQELGQEFFGRIGYAAQQSLYTVSELSDWSSQDHTLSAQVEHVLSPRIRAGLSLYGALGLVGVSELRPRGVDLGAQMYVAYHLNRIHRFQVGVGLGRAFALATEFDYLAGSAIDANLSYQWLQARFRGFTSVYLRGQGLGEQLLAGDLPTTAELQQLGCFETLAIPSGSCEARYRVPLSYDAVGLSAAAAYQWFPLLRPMVRVAVEGRLYRQPFVRELVSAQAAVTSRAEVAVQHDLRLRALAGVTWTLTSYLRLFTGYELSFGASNVTGGVLDYGDESFVRHWAQVELMLTL